MQYNQQRGLGGVALGAVHLLSLINPVVATLFFLTFLAIWHRQPHRTYILSWSLTYAAASIGWGIDFLRDPLGDWLTSFAANPFLFLVAFFTARGTCLRYSGDAQDRTLLPIYLATVAVSSFAGLVLADAFWRGTLGGTGMALMLVVAVAAVWRSQPREFIDRGILLVLGLVVCVLLARPVASLLIEGRPTVESAVADSLWVVSVKLMAIFSWIPFAILFLVRIAHDLMEDLARQSVTDPLTGLLNRRGFFEQADLCMKEASAASPVAVLLCDIDRFKRINDRHGHAVGDRVIQSLAASLRGAAGDRGVIARLGGEELAIIMPACDETVARLLADGLRSCFAARDHACPALRPAPTVSVGIAVATGGEEIDPVLERADAALYEAKRSGRDRTSVFSLKPKAAVA